MWALRLSCPDSQGAGGYFLSDSEGLQTPHSSVSSTLDIPLALVPGKYYASLCGHGHFHHKRLSIQDYSAQWKGRGEEFRLKGELKHSW